MKKMLLPVLFSLAVAVCRADGPYHFIKEIPVSGEGSWDYCSVDPAGQRLYVSHGAEVVVIDLARDQVFGVITNTPGVHGLAPAPELGRGFVSCGKENKAAIVDLKTLQILSKVDTGQNPDSMLYEPGQQEAYMFNGRGQSATVIDAKAGKVVATIPLGGKPEFAQADSKAGRVFNNIEDKNELVKVDVQTLKVVERWKLAPCETPTALAIDRQNQRLFAGCRSGIMAVVDASNGRLVATAPIGARVDAGAFDPETRTIYLSNGDGTVNLFHQDSADKYSVVETITTQFGAKTMALDLKSKTLYLSTADYEAAESGSNRRRVKPGTFGVLVVSK